MPFLPQRRLINQEVTTANNFKGIQKGNKPKPNKKIQNKTNEN